tara:strand:+ start:2218 stop:2928 length:711 start_codon:yes stop_codon:yes gene_type:complete
MSDIKKVAFCWFGQYRSMDTTFPMNVENINQYNGHKEHFYSTWSETRDIGKIVSNQNDDILGYEPALSKNKTTITYSDFKKLYDFKKGYIHSVETELELVKANPSDKIQKYGQKELLTFNSMIMHFKSFINDIKDGNFDLVILLRCDVLYEFNLNTILKHNIDNNKVYVCGEPNLNQINDWLFVGTSNSMVHFINDLKYGIGSAHEDWVSYIEKKEKISFHSIESIPNFKINQTIL